jgi:hypothetical protein
MSGGWIDWSTQKGWLAWWRRHHAAWPLPAVVVHALVLAASSRVWTETVRTYNRSGVASDMPIAHHRLLFLGAACALYWGTYVLGDLMFMGGRGLRTPTAGEKGCVIAIARSAALLLMYWSAVRIIQQGW